MRCRVQWAYGAGTVSAVSGRAVLPMRHPCLFLAWQAGRVACKRCNTCPVARIHHGLGRDPAAANTGDIGQFQVIGDGPPMARRPSAFAPRLGAVQ